MSGGGQRCCPPSRCPPPQGLTLSPLGPGAPASPCEEGEMVRHCKDAQWGAGSTSLETPIPGGVPFSPPSSPAPRVPHLVPTLPPVPRQALQERGEGWSGRDPDRGAAGEGGIYRRPAIPFWPRAPIFTLREERDVRRGSGMGVPQHHPTPGTGAALARHPLGAGTGNSCPWWWGHEGLWRGHGGAMAVPTRGPGSPRSPLAPGSPAPGVPCQVEGKSSSLSLLFTTPPSHAMSPATPGDTPQSPPTPRVPGAEQAPMCHHPEWAQHPPGGGCSRDTP